VSFFALKVRGFSSAFATFFTMPVLELTIFISIVLALIFIVCFVMEAWRNKSQGVEQTSLLPLADDDADISKMTDSKKDQN